MADELDPIALQILDLLADDGRMSYQAIADQVGLSRPAVMERVKRLEEQGFITGYHARVDRARLGRPVTAFVAVRYPTSTEGEEPEIRALADHPDVLECHHVAGDDCYMLKVAAPSLEKLAGPPQPEGPRASGEHPHHHRPLHRLREAGRAPVAGVLMANLRGRALAAYLIVCIVWGSTYLAIRIGVAHVPPFLFAGARYLLAGGLLGAYALWRGERLPASRRVIGALILLGALFFLGGNGGVVWAEQFLSSGLTSIYVVTAALWTAAFDALVPGGKTRLNGLVLTGLGLGFVGSMMLVGVTPDGSCTPNGPARSR